MVKKPVRYMFNEQALIKGDKVDQTGKKVLIIVIAALSVAYGIIETRHTNDYNDLVLVAAFNLEAACITVAGKRVNRNCRCIPVMHLAVSVSMDIVKHVYLNGLQQVHLASLVIATAAMTAGIVMMESYDWTDNTEAELMSIWVRLCMLILLIMELYETVAGIISRSGGVELFAGFISKGLFFLTVMIMSLPEQGLLNIRRICIMACRMSIVGLLTFGAVLALTHGYAGCSMLNLFAGIFSIFLIMTILICCADKEISPDIEDEYDYDPGERMLKCIGWCNSGEECVNRRQYLESAVKRDFTREYAARIYNNLLYMEDIASIQLRLQEIQKQLIVSKKQDNFYSNIRIRNLEAAGVNMLGKLSIEYHFHTGINDYCPEDMMQLDYETGEKRDD